MLTPKKPMDEAGRLESLRQYRVLNTVRGKPFGEITRLASEICEAPIALITFVEGDRVLFRSKVGITADETSRDVSFCGHAILQKTLFVVPDTKRDRRFKGNPFVVDDPRIRFYAGAPLVDRSGLVLGTLCVLDRKPRRLRPSQLQALRVLARLVMTELEWRRRAERMQRLEIEAANLRLVRVIANRMLHEIGNAILPISTHHQLLRERHADPEFLASLDSVLSDGLRRVSRLMTQMRHLAQENEPASEFVSLRAVVQEAFDSAVKNHRDHSGKLHFQDGASPLQIQGDVAGLTLAFSEIILNALQANPADPEVSICYSVSDAGALPAEVVIDFLDKGRGFVPAQAEQVTLPFFSTRSVGPGLGLSVAKKVIAEHHGTLEIRAAGSTHPGGVRIHLPLPEPAVVQTE